MYILGDFRFRCACSPVLGQASLLVVDDGPDHLQTFDVQLVHLQSDVLGEPLKLTGDAEISR